MIKSLRLLNWKSIENSILHIDPLTIIIGTNASGKSNTLDALLFLQRISQGVGLSQAINGDVNLPGIRGALEWACRKPHNKFKLEVEVGSEVEDVDYKYSISVQILAGKAEVIEEDLTRLTYSPKKKEPVERPLFWTKTEDAEPNSTIPILEYTAKKGRNKREEFNRSHAVLFQIETRNVHKEISQGSKILLTALQKIFIFDPIPSHMRGYVPFSDRLATDGNNVAGVLAGLDESRKILIERVLTSYLKKLPEKDIRRVWAEPVGKFQTDAMLYCEESWTSSNPQDTHTVDARGMSDGSLRYLAIITAVLTREPDSLLVVEEVDNGLHPSRAKFLLDMLKTLGQEHKVDIVITTHNPALLDAAGVKMVPFITVAHRDTESGASKLTHLDDIELLPKIMSSGSLGRASAEGLLESALQGSQN